MKAKIGRGADVTGVLTGPYLTVWLATKQDIRPATRRSYAGHLTNYLIPHLGQSRLDELRVEHVAELLIGVHGGDGAASLMLAAGVDRKVVQETLGHSSITITSDT